MLAPGGVADLISLPLAEVPRGPLGAQSLEAALVYGASGASVSDSMVAGRWLMRGRDLLTVDAAGARARQQEDFDTLAERLAAAEGLSH